MRSVLHLDPSTRASLDRLNPHDPFMIATLALPLVLPSLAPLPQDLELLRHGDVEFTRYDRPMPVPEEEASPASSTFLDLNAAPEGDGPVAMAYSPDGAQVAVVNSDTDLVTFLDTTTRDVIRTVDVGNHPLDVAISPDGTVAVVPNAHDHTVSVIDMATYAVSAVGVTGLQPYRVAITPDSRYAVVGVIGQSGNSSISILDLSAGTEALSFPTSPQGAIGTFSSNSTGVVIQIYTDFSLAPDGVTLLLNDYWGGRLAVHNITTGNKIANINTEGQPFSTDISPDGTLAIVGSSWPEGSLQTIDMGTLSVVDTYDFFDPLFSSRVALTADKQTAFCTDGFTPVRVDLTTGSFSAFPGAAFDLQLTFDDQYLIVGGGQPLVVDVASGAVVDTIDGIAANYRVATSPVEHRAIGLDSLNFEELQFLDVAGAALEGLAETGSNPEADVPRELVLTPDGRRALVGCMSSEHGAYVDLETGTVLSRPDLGRRHLDVAITPDGLTGLGVANQSGDLSVVDLASGATLAVLDVSPHPTQVEVSPDGTEAYVRSDDLLYFVDLAGAASVVTGSLPIEGGWASGGFPMHAYTDLSLSPDGATLALFGRDPYELVLVDAASHTEITRLPTEDGPVVASWSSDSGTIYVTNAWSDSVQQFRDQGGVWAETGKSNNHPSPLRATVGPDDKFVYINCMDLPWGEDPHIRVVRAINMKKVAKIPLPSGPREQVASGDTLLVALTTGSVARIRMDGPNTQLEEIELMSGKAVDIAFSPTLGAAVLTRPIADGLEIVPFGGTPITYCSPAVVNSSGAPGVLTATGTFLAGGQPLNLEATQLPVNEFGLFLTSDTMGLNQPPGSQGNLCLGGTIHRYATDVQFSGAAGAFDLDVDTTSLPLGGAIQPGETWNFQAWFRDANPTPTSNFTDAVSATFE